MIIMIICTYQSSCYCVVTIFEKLTDVIASCTRRGNWGFGGMLHLHGLR